MVTHKFSKQPYVFGLCDDGIDIIEIIIAKRLLSLSCENVLFTVTKLRFNDVTY